MGKKTKRTMSGIFDDIGYDDRLIYGRCCRTTGKGRGYAGIR